MKKSLAILLAMMMVLSFAGVIFAEPIEPLSGPGYTESGIAGIFIDEIDSQTIADP